MVLLDKLASLLNSRGDKFDKVKNLGPALNGMAQFVGCRPTKQKVTSSIPSQGTCLNYGLVSSCGMCKRQLIDACLTHWCFSPSFSSSLPLSLKINKHIFLKPWSKVRRRTIAIKVLWEVTTRWWGEIWGQGDLGTNFTVPQIKLEEVLLWRKVCHTCVKLSCWHTWFELG